MTTLPKKSSWRKICYQTLQKWYDSKWRINTALRIISNRSCIQSKLYPSPDLKKKKEDGKVSKHRCKVLSTRKNNALKYTLPSKAKFEISIEIFLLIRSFCCKFKWCSFEPRKCPSTNHWWWPFPSFISDILFMQNTLVREWTK